MDAAVARPRTVPWPSFLVLSLSGALGATVLFAMSPESISWLDLVLLVVAVGVGCVLAPRVGLTSLIADRASTAEAIWPRLRTHLVPAMVAGVATGFAITVLDFAFWYLVGGDPIGDAGVPTYPISTLVLGLTYGAITEELLLRWGLMTFLAWFLWRIAGHSETGPGARVMGSAVILAAVLFGVAHLPTLAAAGGLSPELVIRTIGLNALAGTVYGWAYWRRCLEAGMIAHGATHVGFFISIPLVGVVIQALPM